MKKSIILFVLINFGYFCACTSDTEAPISKTTGTDQEPKEVFFNVDFKVDRMLPINRSILPQVVSNLSGKNASNDAATTNQQPYYWTWVAQLSAPQINAMDLSATHCAVQGNRAYVSYNKQGDQHLGAVEIIDISDPAQPQLLEQIQFTQADVNAITALSTTEIWVATSHQKLGAVVYRLNPEADSYDRINLSNALNNGISASANGIAYTNTSILVSGGKTYGGTFKINRNSLVVESFDAYANAKYVQTNGQGESSDFITLTTGSNAALYTGKPSDIGTTLTSFDITPIDHLNVEQAQRGKNTITFDPFDPNKIYCAMGGTGLKAYNINTGALLNESKGSMLTEGNTNAISLDEDYMYIANGADGIAIGEHVVDGETINPMFVWDRVEMPASANYVTAQNDYVFVCKGLGGFHILDKQEKSPYMTVTPYTNTGKPITLEEDEVICSELLPNLFSAILPERQNAITAHPEYFEHPMKNIVLTEEAEVSVTFINEGAGYKNVLGYYYYDTDTPPNSLDEVVKIVIFPNASAQGSGGELIPGNTVKLLGTFPAGTEIGFFVIADGWRNQKITEGFYSQHTDIAFNGSGHQQSLIFHDPACQATIICFEDISIPQGDKDFNDAIFQVNTLPASALATQDYIQIR
jgi:hypothetical protein